GRKSEGARRGPRPGALRRPSSRCAAAAGRRSDQRCVQEPSHERGRPGGLRACACQMQGGVTMPLEGCEHLPEKLIRLFETKVERPRALRARLPQERTELLIRIAEVEARLGDADLSR